MHNPSHPGEVLRELCLDPMGISITEAAEALGVTRKTLSTILNGRAGISPEMAVLSSSLNVRLRGFQGGIIYDQGRRKKYCPDGTSGFATA